MTKNQSSIIFSLALVLLLGLAQLVFGALMSANASRVRGVVETLLRSEIERADFDRLSIFARNLEGNNLFNCARLTLLKEKSKVVIYESPITENCDPSLFFLEGYKAQVQLRSDDGQNWFFEFVIPPSGVNIVLLWLLRFFLVLSAGIGLYAFWLRIDEHIRRQDAIEMHLKGIAHDLRSPLGGLRVLQQNPKLLENEKGIDLFAKCITRLSNIIDSTLSGSGVNLPGGENAFKFFDCVNESINAFRDGLSFQNLENVNIKLRSNLNNTAVNAIGEYSDFQRVLVNFLQNSLEACVGAESLKISIDVTLSDTSENVYLEIFDSGPGFTDDQVMAFKRGENTSTKTTGNGLGLQLARRMIGSWGGSLVITGSSNPGVMLKVSLKKRK